MNQGPSDLPTDTDDARLTSEDGYVYVSLPLKLEGGGLSAEQVAGTFRGYSIQKNEYRRAVLVLGSGGGAERSGFVWTQGSYASPRYEYMINDSGHVIVSLGYGADVNFPGHPGVQGIALHTLKLDDDGKLVEASGDIYYLCSHCEGMYPSPQIGRAVLKRTQKPVVPPKPTVQFSGSFSGQTGDA